ncbi:MAG: hypothetical protein WBA41_26150 [Rivularia sp. (in: cyanobacteria)]
MKPLEELRKVSKHELQNDLFNHFKVNWIVIRMRNPPRGRKLAEYKRLVIINHPTDENQWFVSIDIPSRLELLTCGLRFTMLTYKGKQYIPLPVLEQATGEQFPNIREAIARNVERVKREIANEKANE